MRISVILWRIIVCAEHARFIIGEEKTLYYLPLKICLAGNDLSVQLPIIG